MPIRLRVGVGEKNEQSRWVNTKHPTTSNPCVKSFFHFRPFVFPYLTHLTHLTFRIPVASLLFLKYYHPRLQHNGHPSRLKPHVCTQRPSCSFLARGNGELENPGPTNTLLVCIPTIPWYSHDVSTLFFTFQIHVYHIDSLSSDHLAFGGGWQLPVFFSSTHFPIYQYLSKWCGFNLSDVSDITFFLLTFPQQKNILHNSELVVNSNVPAIIP